MYHYIGIDVSKATLQVYIPIKDENISIENTQRAIKSLYGKLKKYYKKEYQNLVFIFESTGSYSSLLKQFCSEHHIYAYIINPRQSANFAKALDNRNKSDIIDAKMLYRFHILLNDTDITIPIIDHDKEAIGEVLSYYQLLVKQRTALTNHLEAVKAKQSNGFIVKKLQQDIKRYQKQEAELLSQVKQIILSNDALHDKFKVIKTFKGIGDLSAMVLLHLFISYPEANRQEITALSGLDCIETSSGTSLQKKTKISKRGNALYRGMLFMPVMASLQHNPYMKAFYDRLKENGKHSNAAQIAVMRKMILIAHSLYKSGQPFDPEFYEKRIGWNQ
jgi:transposase